MASSLTWLDYSGQQRRQMLDVIHLFAEKTTRDELGLVLVKKAIQAGKAFVSAPRAFARELTRMPTSDGSGPTDQPLAWRPELWRGTGCDPKADVFSGR
jgi:hypothetical protein